MPERQKASKSEQQVERAREQREAEDFHEKDGVDDRRRNQSERNEGGHSKNLHRSTPLNGMYRTAQRAGSKGRSPSRRRSPCWTPPDKKPLSGLLRHRGRSR